MMPFAAGTQWVLGERNFVSVFFPQKKRKKRGKHHRFDKHREPQHHVAVHGKKKSCLSLQAPGECWGKQKGKNHNGKNNIT